MQPEPAPLSDKALAALLDDILADCTAKGIQRIWERAIFNKQNGWQVLADLFNANRPSSIAAKPATSDVALSAEQVREAYEKCGHISFKDKQYAAIAECLNVTLAAHDQKVREVLRKLLDACLLADSHEELSGYVDGSLLDAAREALAATATQKESA